jgi:hypothetical protein
LFVASEEEKDLNIGICENKTGRKNVFADNLRKIRRRFYATLSVRSVIYSKNTD